MQPTNTPDTGKPGSGKPIPDQGNPATSSFERHRCPFENIPDPALEDAQIEETVQLLIHLLDKRYPLQDDQRKFLSEHYPASIQCLRGVHPKSHGCVNADFEVDDDLESDYRIGLFKDPGKRFRAVIRFSNAAALVGPDTDAQGRHGSRGMAIKLFNVGGRVLSEDQGAHNQDFLMINQPNFAFANTEDYLRLNRILLARNDDPSAFFAPLKLRIPNLDEAEKQQILKYIRAENIQEDDIKRIGDSFQIIQALQATPVVNPLAVPYFSAAPFLFGPDRVMKFSVRPRFRMPASTLPQSPSDNYLRESLQQTMRGNGTYVFDFLVQVRSDVPVDEIENASNIWDRTLFPFVRVATVTIYAPQLYIETTDAIERCEKMAFTPWHCLEEHQPIGSINRLRKAVYDASATHRLQK